MLSWLRSLDLGGTGLVPTVNVASSTPAVVAPGCTTNPCFVCKLRKTIQTALLRHPGYREVLKQELEEREERLRKHAENNRPPKRSKGKKGALAAPPPAPPTPPSVVDQPVLPPPLELHIVGLRREHSLTNAFDDQMVVFCRLPTAEEMKKIEAAAGPLLQPLEEAFKQVTDNVRVVCCSSVAWLVALFPVSTDPGLKAVLQDLDAKIAATKKAVDDAKAAHAGQKRIAAAESKLASAEKSKAELSRKNVLVDGGWVVEDRGMMLPGYFPDAYKFGIHHGHGEHFAKDTSLTALTTGSVPALRHVSGRYIRSRPGKFGGVARMVEELRTASGTRSFEATEARLVLGPGPEEDTKGEASAPTKGKKGKKPPRLWNAEIEIPSTKEKIAVQDDDYLLLRMTAGGTNIHRAHNVKLPASGQRLQGGAPSDKVASWSEGCQVFPDWKDFNFFITLCAVAKRWRCASFHRRTPKDHECDVLEVGEGKELGRGERALVDVHGALDENGKIIGLLGECADENRKKGETSASGPVHQTFATIDELTWTEDDRKKMDELQELEATLKKKGKELPSKERDTLKDLREKKSHQRSEEEEKRLGDAYAAQQKWRREYLREKTRRLAADHLQICDLNGTCPASFSYALVEMNQDELTLIGDSFKNPLNPKWSGKLL